MRWVWNLSANVTSLVPCELVPPTQPPPATGGQDLGFAERVRGVDLPAGHTLASNSAATVGLKEALRTAVAVEMETRVSLTTILGYNSNQRITPP